MISDDVVVYILFLGPISYIQSPFTFVINLSILMSILYCCRAMLRQALNRPQLEGSGDAGSGDAAGERIMLTENEYYHHFPNGTIIVGEHGVWEYTPHPYGHRRFIGKFGLSNVLWHISHFHSAPRMGVRRAPK